ncbi:MAG: S41 family peptidase [Candidatus Latescibacteria bacterium]|nr:S41 family peptidase [Candidatus Latescibacterota bacterium]
MKRWAKYSLVFVVAAGALGFVAGFGLRGATAIGGADGQVTSQERRRIVRQVQEEMRLMGTVLNQVSMAYYEDVDVHELAVAGIKGMLSRLDPYSDFYVEEQDEGAVADLEITTTGTYSGIGATIGYAGGVLSIISPMKGSPALGAGLQAGDVIAEIDGTPSRHFSTAKAASMIKGPVGTQVTLMIEREGIPEPLEIIITRAQIEVNDVSAAVFAAPGIAYVEIGRFTRNTGRFLLEALRKLEAEQPMEGLILDLRGNPGGMLDEAVAVADPFLPRGELVVYTRGRIPEMKADLETKEDQFFKGRLVVLVNQGSASASEIVAGAVQDLDRGVIVGKTSFGKGLVQSVGEISEGNKFRLTTGEYFTPSGRNLQRPFVRNPAGRLVVRNPSLPDTTEHPIYASRNGRTVSGGGGVVPDIEVDGLMGNILLFDLKFRRAMFLRYVNNYVNTRGIEQGSRVTVDDALLNDFRRWTEEHGFTFRSPTEMRLEDLLETAEAEEVADELATEIEALQRAIDRQKNYMWRDSWDKIALELRREFVTKLEGYEAGRLTYMREDPQFQAAIGVVQDSQQYSSILSGAGEDNPANSQQPEAENPGLEEPEEEESEIAET